MSVPEVFRAEAADRYTLFPIQHENLWRMYKQQVACFWTSEEIDLGQDRDDWAKLSDNERYFISHVLAFFASSDGIVLENLGKRFINDVELPEARCFYGFQMAMENIHSETYSLLIDTYVKDPAKKHDLFKAMEKVPCILNKAEWALRWVDDEEASFALRLIAFACVEGIFFSGSFCAIFWLKKRGLMPGLTFSNELISRDEGMHCDFACTLYGMIPAIDRLSQEKIHDVFRSAVDVELSFVLDSLPVALIGMNGDLMAQYIKFTADRLLKQLGYAPLYNTTNPFDWMELISMEGKTNFFEKRVGEYQKSGVLNGRGNFELDADF